MTGAVWRWLWIRNEIGLTLREARLMELPRDWIDMMDRGPEREIREAQRPVTRVVEHTTEVTPLHWIRCPDRIRPTPTHSVNDRHWDHRPTQAVASNHGFDMGRNKIGRNDPCHCGSGRKYKKCHLNRDERSGGRRRIGQQRIPEAILAQLRQNEAQEAVRKRAQGEGRPIISAEFKGHRFVAAGNKLYFSPLERTQTFADFLSNYIREVLGQDWGNAEIAKPEEQRHPVVKWYQAVANQQQAVAMVQGRIFSMQATGAVVAYNALAYNLYLLQHNAEVQAHLLERIKNPDSYYGGYYETHVAAWFILAGFTLELEDERDPATSHCEFTATSPTGLKFSIEAKTRAPGKDSLAIGNQLVKALRKEAKHQRIIFIDMNLPMTKSFTEEDYYLPIVERVRRKEALTIQGRPAPPAYVIVTNLPFHLHLDDQQAALAIVAEGYKLEDFGHVSYPSLVAAHKAEQKHAATYRVLEAARTYRIPATFDGELPEFAFGEAQRLLIGENYRFEDGRVGVLRNGFVFEPSQESMLVVEVDGQQMLYRGTLTDEELAAYRSHPETFFGQLQRVTNREAKNPYELFRFFLDAHENSSRENLLKQLKNSTDYAELEKLPLDELRLIHAERVTWGALSHQQQPPVSDTPFQG